jgi:hypothetical protein
VWYKCNSQSWFSSFLEMNRHKTWLNGLAIVTWLKNRTWHKYSSFYSNVLMVKWRHQCQMTSLLLLLCSWCAMPNHEVLTSSCLWRHLHHACEAIWGFWGKTHVGKTPCRINALTTRKLWEWKVPVDAFIMCIFLANQLPVIDKVNGVSHNLLPLTLPGLDLSDPKLWRTESWLE